MGKPVIYDGDLATQVLDLVESVAVAVDPSVSVRFEGLSAEPGELPRLMVQLIESSGDDARYISGERLVPFPFALILRVAADDEQSRLDAAAFLAETAKGFIAQCVALDGYVCYTRPRAGAPFCLGRSDAFEDWQVTFDLSYKQSR